MSEPFSNNATPKYLGYVYQVLIAIEQCFQAKKNETIWIECYGDVYDGKESTEVKHHFGKTNLTSNSEDFWKTLKNLVTENVSEINAFILHTTADIPDDSIFFGWDELSKIKKYDRLKKHMPVAGIKPHYDAVMVKPKEELLTILEKLTIKSSQLNVRDKWDELKEAQIFTLIDEKYKDDAFHWVYGYVNKKAIEDRHNWNIKINDFNSALRYKLSKYTQDKMPFEYVKKTEINSDARNFLFVEEMKNIKLRETPIQRAISDYIRACESLIKFLEKQASISEVLDDYDSSVLESVELLKYEYCANIEEPELNTKKTFDIARNLYFGSMNLQLIPIPQVTDTQKYYQNGRIHSNVNEKKFVWRICEEDLL